MNYDNYKLQAEPTTENVFEFLIANYDETMLFDTVEEAEEQIEFLKEEGEYNNTMKIIFSIKY